MRTFAECTLPGHPDKLSDRIADALVDAALTRDTDALVGIEVAVHRDHVFIDGRIACPGAESIDVDRIARRICTTSGYGATFGPNPEHLHILQDLCLGDFRPEERDIRRLADDQNIVTGYAEAQPETHYLPTAHRVARVCAEELDRERRSAPKLFGPDGKILIVARDEWDGTRHQARCNIEAMSCSVQHHPKVGTVDIIDAVKRVRAAAQQRLASIPALTWEEHPDALLVNGAGDFAVGGPEGDNGLSGKKLVVDAFGPHVPIGGGALSGKDPHKIDRTAALRARQIAKHLVMAGVAERALVHLAYAPGDTNPRWSEIQFGTHDPAAHTLTWKRADPVFARRWLSGYDCSIAGTFRDLQLHAMRWEHLATWGHFGDPELPWERWSPGSGTQGA
ncbi:methionine adenosyltransferase domain-containing protein [Candidatus Uhrbacteria bacterium]|nr:methionine adenosyltransferase domain-containing protein [Candidatus Uhrbacteria bacterium]